MVRFTLRCVRPRSVPCVLASFCSLLTKDDVHWCKLWKQKKKNLPRQTKNSRKRSFVNYFYRKWNHSLYIAFPRPLVLDLIPKTSATAQAMPLLCWNMGNFNSNSKCQYWATICWNVTVSYKKAVRLNVYIDANISIISIQGWEKMLLALLGSWYASNLQVDGT